MAKYTYLVPTPRHLASLYNLGPALNVRPDDKSQGPYFRLELGVQRTWPLEPAQVKTHNLQPGPACPIDSLQVSSVDPTIIPGFDLHAIHAYLDKYARTLALGRTCSITITSPARPADDQFFVFVNDGDDSFLSKLVLALPKSFDLRPPDEQKAAVASLMRAIGHTTTPRSVKITQSPTGRNEITVAGEQYSAALYAAATKHKGVALLFRGDAMISKPNANGLDLFHAMGPAISQILGPLTNKPLELVWDYRLSSKPAPNDRPLNDDLDTLQSRPLGLVNVGWRATASDTDTPFKLPAMLLDQPNNADPNLESGRISGTWKNGKVKVSIYGFYSLFIQPEGVVLQVECSKNPSALFVDHLKFIVAPKQSKKRK